jgi:hypothetical protein
MKLSLCGALGQRKQSFMLGGSCVPMTLRQMVPLMSPAEGRALCSSFTSLHHPPQCHRQATVLACNDSSPLRPHNTG